MAAPNPLLDQLRPNHLPDPVGLWPVAIGWWILAALALSLVVFALRYIYRRWQKNRYRSAALTQARQAANDYAKHQSVNRLAHECNTLLRRVALQAFDRHQVASLSGVHWSEFLAKSANMPEFIDHSAFSNQRYNPDAPLCAQNIYELTRQWIKKHHASI